MATDFAQEAKWKKAAAKTLANAVKKYFAEKQEERRREEEEERSRGKALAAAIANEVMTQFWGRVKAVAAIKVNTLNKQANKQNSTRTYKRLFELTNQPTNQQCSDQTNNHMNKQTNEIGKSDV
mgnify:CR=1 FL=1